SSFPDGGSTHPEWHSRDCGAPGVSAHTTSGSPELPSRTTPMPFAAALSTTADTARALAEVCDAAGGQLGRRAGLARAFLPPHRAGDGELVAAALAEQLSTANVVGCLGESVVGPAREVEQGPAVSLWLAEFGGAVDVETFHLNPDQGREGPTLFG